MLKEIKTKVELDLLLNNSFSLHKVSTAKEPIKKFFFIKSGRSYNSIQDVTSLVNEEDIENFILPLDVEIFDYIIENEMIDMEDIDYSDTIEFEFIVEKYPKVIEYIDDEILDDLLCGEKLDIYEISRRSALELYTSKYLIKKANKKELLKQLDNDNDFSKDQKKYLKEFVSKNII